MSRLGSLSPEDGARRQRGTGQLDLNCPPLPHTLFEAMRLMENPGLADHKRVVRMAENDPLVAGRLLRVVNSPYYGFASQVEDVNRAVRLLGPTSVAGIVMGMNVIRLQSTMDGPGGALFTRLMRHSLATANYAGWLWERLKPRSESRAAYSAGLLHDFGKIVLLYNYPDDAQVLYAEPEERSDDDWALAETGLFGCSARTAGRYVAESLDISKELAAQLRGDGDDDLTTVIRAADVAARGVGFWFNQSLDADEAAEHPVWDEVVTRFPYRAGEPDELYEAVTQRKDEVERYLFQLLRRKSDRSAIPPARNPGGPRRRASD